MLAQRDSSLGHAASELPISDRSFHRWLSQLRDDATTHESFSLAHWRDTHVMASRTFRWFNNYTIMNMNDTQRTYDNKSFISDSGHMQWLLLISWMHLSRWEKSSIPRQLSQLQPSFLGPVLQSCDWMGKSLEKNDKTPTHNYSTQDKVNNI